MLIDASHGYENLENKSQTRLMTLRRNTDLRSRHFTLLSKRCRRSWTLNLL